MKILAIAMSVLLGGYCSVSVAQDTGDLKISFKLRGAAPKPKPIAGAGAFCGQFKHLDQSLLVDPKSNAIKNVVVYVYTGRRGTDLGPQKPREKVVELANKNCRFEPHVVLLQTNDTLKVTNPDPVGHNVNLPFFANGALNVLIPPNQFKEVLVPKAEPTLIPVACNIHPWMLAHVLVVDHPFFGISDEEGVVEIKGLPAGDEIIFRAWHERLTFKDKIFVNEKETKWKSNKFEIEIEPGLNDIGVVAVPL
jgi:hypothetical protein